MSVLSLRIARRAVVLLPVLVVAGLVGPAANATVNPVQGVPCEGFLLPSEGLSSSHVEVGGGPVAVAAAGSSTLTCSTRQDTNSYLAPADEQSANTSPALLYLPPFQLTDHSDAHVYVCTDVELPDGERWYYDYTTYTPVSGGPKVHKGFITDRSVARCGKVT